MKVSDEILELIEILSREGFGHLAGEVLTEISLGLEEEREVDEAPGWTPSADDFVEVGDGMRFLRRYKDVDEGRSAPPATRRQMSDDEQLAFAADFITARLVEPLRRLAEAERTAGELAILPEPPPEPDSRQGKAAVPASTEAASVPASPEAASETARTERIEKEPPGDESADFAADPVRILFLEAPSGADDDASVEDKEEAGDDRGGSRAKEEADAVSDRTVDEGAPGSEIALDRLSAVLERLRAGSA